MYIQDFDSPGSRLLRFSNSYLMRSEVYYCLMLVSIPLKLKNGRLKDVTMQQMRTWNLERLERIGRVMVRYTNVCCMVFSSVMPRQY